MRSFTRNRFPIKITVRQNYDDGWQMRLNQFNEKGNKREFLIMFYQHQ